MTAAAMTHPTPDESDALDREVLASLLSRRDAPGLVRFGVQLVALLTASTATAWLAASDSPLAWGAAALAAVSLLTFFPSMHEAGHGTAFRTRWLNEATVWISATLMLQAPSFFREFHWEHHRHTQDPVQDPEINAAPSLLDDWPANAFAYLFSVCGQPLMVGKAGFTLVCALLPSTFWARLFPFIPERARSRVASESRVAIAALGALAWAGLSWIDGFAMVLLAWPIAHLLLGFYLMPEHTGLPHHGSQLARTRSVETHPIVNWLMWNMPLHAVHHEQPGVPFHAVPALHRHFTPRLQHVSPGYVAFHREAIQRLRGRSG